MAITQKKIDDLMAQKESLPSEIEALKDKIKAYNADIELIESKRKKAYENLKEKEAKLLAIIEIEK